jgi:transcriptional regulator with XRE-family HTH domain
VAPVDVKRAADLYAQGWTLRQIAAQLGVHRATVSERLHQAGVTRRGAPPHPATTQQILELRDQGLTWTEVGRTGRYDGFRCLEPLSEEPDRQSHRAWAVGSSFRRCT